MLTLKYEENEQAYHLMVRDYDDDTHNNKSVTSALPAF